MFHFCGNNSCGRSCNSYFGLIELQYRASAVNTRRIRGGRCIKYARQLALGGTMVYKMFSSSVQNMKFTWAIFADFKVCPGAHVVIP